MFAEVKLLQNEVDKYVEVIETATERNDELKQKYTEMTDHEKPKVERLNTLVPSSIDEIKILTDLAEMAGRHNMLFGNVSVSNNEIEKKDDTDAFAVAFKDLESTDLQFSLIGTYEQFKAFLGEVESSLVLLEVNGVAFTSGEGLFQQYELSVRVYALPPENN
jgi:acetolactate synthase small subunit